ncbi:MAG: hypothetical protein IJN92_08610 [Lachnospiraceae bacterium]|nr:hypothetical protein [Lachnospiraceae bacterium]
MEEGSKKRTNIFEIIFLSVDIFVAVCSLPTIIQGDTKLLLLQVAVVVMFVIGITKNLPAGYAVLEVIMLLIVISFTVSAGSTETVKEVNTNSEGALGTYRAEEEQTEETLIEENEEDEEDVEKRNAEEAEKKRIEEEQAEADRIEKEKEAAEKKEEEYREKNEENAGYIATQLSDSDLDFKNMGILQQTFTGQLEESDTVNQYVLNYDRNVPVWLLFRHSNLTEDRYGWKIELTDSEGNLLDRFYSNWNREEEYSKISGIKEGQYIITVSKDDSYSEIPYTLEVYYADMNNFETEPNDEVSTANDMHINSETGIATVYGSLNFDSDKDFYAFSLPEDGHIAFKFEHLNQTEDRTGWRVILWNQQSEEMFSFYSNWNKESSYSFNEGLPAGNYYAIVKREDSWNTTPYAISLIYQKAENWESEFNDSILDADMINSSIPYYGTIHNYDDKDYYRFICAESGEYEIEFSHDIIEEGYGWYMEVLNSDSDQLEEGQMYSYGNESANSIKLQFEEGEEYYILVKWEWNYSAEDYSIVIRK